MTSGSLAQVKWPLRGQPLNISTFVWLSCRDRGYSSLKITQGIAPGSNCLFMTQEIEPSWLASHTTIFTAEPWPRQHNRKLEAQTKMDISISTKNRKWLFTHHCINSGTSSLAVFPEQLLNNRNQYKRIKLDPQRRFHNSISHLIPTL